jgi:hypothetical protein
MTQNRPKDELSPTGRLSYQSDLSKDMVEISLDGNDSITPKPKAAPAHASPRKPIHTKLVSLKGPMGN